MLKLFNSLGKRMEAFVPANASVTNIFTCGPSVYQRSHIGNYRTFLFEDTLVRYLEYCGFRVTRGMNFTDIEDKALVEARRRGTTLRRLTDKNIGIFTKEMKQLRMKTPDYLPRASENVESAVEIIESLLRKGMAYRHGANIYFDPLKFPRFGILYGLDMRRWPKKKIRFHKDTYPGMRWNRGDFILWHGCTGGRPRLLGYAPGKRVAGLEHPGPEHDRPPVRRDPVHLLRRHRQPRPAPRLLSGHPGVHPPLSHGKILAALSSPARGWEKDVQEPRQHRLRGNAHEQRVHGAGGPVLPDRRALPPQNELS